jgi:putative hemolysin
MTSGGDTLLPGIPLGERIIGRADQQQYAMRMATRVEDIHAAQVLRFEIFNLELHEGLEQSFALGRDEDPFDAVCDHLLVEDASTGAVVGTYRLQTGRTAAEKLGYYSAQEFDFTPYEPVRDEIIELGRACVHRNHRNLSVLGLLWKGIAAYARDRKSRYLIGCSSLTSQDPGEGAAMYADLRRRHLPQQAFRTVPLAHYACPMDSPADKPPKVPKLLAAYLSLGAKICGPPAIVREFKTIDFLTLLDLDSLPLRMVRRYLT